MTVRRPAFEPRRPWMIARCWSALIAAALLFHAPAHAESSTYSYLDFNIDESKVAPDQRPVLEQGLREQIDLVNSLSIDARTAAFLRSVPVRVDPLLREAGHYDQSGLRLWDRHAPADNPVLLHELLHAWLSQASTADRQVIRAAYEEAKKSGKYPRDAYMMSDVAEFFAMTTSVVLWGKAARLPFERDRVRADMPDYFAWLVDRFGLRL